MHDFKGRAASSISNNNCSIVITKSMMRQGMEWTFALKVWLTVQRAIYILHDMEHKEGVWQSNAVQRLQHGSAHLHSSDKGPCTTITPDISVKVSPSQHTATQIAVSFSLRAPYSSGTVSSLETQSYNTTHMQIIDRHNWGRAGQRAALSSQSQVESAAITSHSTVQPQDPSPLKVWDYAAFPNSVGHLQNCVLGHAPQHTPIVSWRACLLTEQQINGTPQCAEQSCPGAASLASGWLTVPHTASGRSCPVGFC